MNSLTRRRFLAASGVTATVAAGAALGWFELIDRARTDPLPTDAQVLVLLTLYGGNDGLGTIIPAADPAYQQARPDLAYAEHEILPLGERLGLNPVMTGLKKLWDDRHLAIVRGVSYPQPDHSHFRSMAIWQTASPNDPLPTGWLGRWLDASGSDPLLAVSIGPVLPPMLAGATTP
ncbi:MAG: twin-arginine translocation signal domain-containing protein, partial [Pseudonocardiaceae bacterium]